MVLKLFFDISTSFRFSKDQCECTLHSEAPLAYTWNISKVYWVIIESTDSNSAAAVLLTLPCQFRKENKPFGIYHGNAHCSAQVP